MFVDAVLPGEDRPFLPSQGFVDFIDALPTHGGLLPPWHQWWPADTMNALIPDERVRGAVIAEIPEVPRSFYDASIDAPPSWWTRPAAYLRLSAAYDDDVTRAEAWNWPTVRRSGRHLDLVVRPTEIAQYIVSLAERLMARPVTGPPHTHDGLVAPRLWGARNPVTPPS